MKKNYFKVFATSLFLFSTLNSINHSNKNFWMPKPPGRDLATDNSSWYQVKRDGYQKNKNLSESIQVIGFFKESVNSSKFGSFFWNKRKK